MRKYRVIAQASDLILGHQVQYAKIFEATDPDEAMAKAQRDIQKVNNNLIQAGFPQVQTEIETTIVKIQQI